MALNDLTNPIHLPNGIDTANSNPIAKAEKVVVTGRNKSVTEAIDGKADRNSSNDISSLESKVDALYPLTPNVNKLNDFSTIYDPIHGAATVSIVNGYSLIADYRAEGDRYESSGVTYDSSATDVVRYSGLSNDLHRSFAFKIAGASDKILMSIGAGSSAIPFIDITAAGRIRVNNFTPAQTVAQNISNQPHRLTRSAGTSIVSTTPGSVATFTVTNFPSGATNKVRTIQLGADVRLNGTDTLAEGLMTFSAPSENIAQTKQTITHTFQLGPLHQNRNVFGTFGYEFRVSGSDLLMDITVENASLSSGDESISFDFEPDTDALLSYTAQTTVARVDQWVNLSDGSTDILVTGNDEFILSARPDIPADGSEPTLIDMVPAIVNAAGTVTQLNDATVAIPNPLWASIEIPDDIGFRTFEANHYFRHSEVASLLGHRAEKWVYGLARLETANSGKSLTEAIDLHSGSTIGGEAISTLKPELVVFQSPNKLAQPGGMESQVTLPSNYTDYAYVHITEYDTSSLQWRHSEISIAMLASGDVDTNDNIRLQGNTVMQFIDTSRVLSMNPSVREIYRVVLKD